MPKGDADNLRADLDDGYCRVSYLLAEALSIMPLTPTEHGVLWAVMRCTYGWAKDTDRKTGRFARLSSKLLADTIGASKRTVDTALGTLVKMHVLLRVEIEPGNVFAYGVNPEVTDWGDGKAVWREAQVHLRHTRQAGTYTRNRVQLYAETSIGIREIGDSYTQECVEEKAGSPRAPGPEGTSYNESVTENVVTTLASDERPSSATPPSNAGLEGQPEAEQQTDATAQPTAKAQRKAEREAKRETDEAALAEVRSQFDDADLPHVDDFIGMVRGHRANRRLTPSAELRYTRELLALRTESGMTSEKFGHGLCAAICKDIDNVNYAKKAARGFAAEHGRQPTLSITPGTPPSRADPTPEEVAAAVARIPEPTVGGGIALPYQPPTR